MRKRTFTSSASALLLLTATLVSAKHASHDHLDILHRRHRATRQVEPRSTSENGEAGVEIRAIAETTGPKVEKRGGSCQFPTDAGLVPVTMGAQNAGWAMSPDQPCKPGNYCPFACPPGQVSMQWDPSATSYSYPKSMNGGLYCDNNGNIQKPFPDRPYCQSTSSNIGVQNRAGGVVSFCQTVLPGNEAMLIPTSVSDYASIAVPDPNYWCSTAAHYYINPPGIGTEQACVWGTNANPVGNWSPYVAGTNVDASGQTFIKLGWNPIYLEPTTPFRNEMPNWGVRIECPNGGCNGLPCAIDPTQNKVNSMQGSASNGAGGGSFCVVTVSKGATANFVVFNAGGDTSSNTGGGHSSNGGDSESSTWRNNNNGAGQFYQSSTDTPDAASSTVEAEPTSTYTSTSWAAETTTTTLASSSTTVMSYDRNWPMSNSTTYTQGRPSQSPYYSLFHTESAATSTASSGRSGEAVTTQAPSSTQAAPSLKTATGAASLMHASMLGLVSSAALCILASL